MIPISSTISGELSWSKTSYKREYELKRNGEVVASLRQTSFWTTEFQAESAHGSWKLRRTGCFQTGTEIVDANSAVRIGIFKRNWTGGGTLAFSDGLTLQITSKGFWRPVWAVLTEGGQLVLSIRAREKAVDLPKESHLSDDRLILLTIFAWHIMQQAAEEAASTAALVAVTP